MAASECAVCFRKLVAAGHADCDDRRGEPIGARRSPITVPLSSITTDGPILFVARNSSFSVVRTLCGAFCWLQKWALYEGQASSSCLGNHPFRMIEAVSFPDGQ